MNARRSAVVLGLVLTLGLSLLHAAVHAADGTTLKYKFAKGDKFLYRGTMEMKQSQTIMGKAVENEMTNDGISTYTIDAVDEKGNAQITVKGERLKSNAKFALLGNLTFDSQSNERDQSTAIGLALTPLMERMSGITYQATIAPAGGVLALKGYEDQLRDLVANNTLAAQFAGGGTDDTAKQGLEELFPKIAKPVVKPGDTWNIPIELSMGKVGKMTGKSTFRFVGLDKVGERDTAKLEVTTEMSVELDVDMDGAKVTGTIKSTSGSGTVQFDIVAGRVLTSQSTISMSGNLNVNVGDMNIPIQNDQTMSTTVEYLEKLPK